MVSLLQLNAIEVAMQLMVEDFTVFRMIGEVMVIFLGVTKLIHTLSGSLPEPTEYVDKLFELESKFGTPNLEKFDKLVNAEMMWAITAVVSEPNVKRRASVIKQLIKVAHHCFKETQNYNCMFAITSGLEHGAVRRLKASWDRVPAKYHKLVSSFKKSALKTKFTSLVLAQHSEMQTVMDPSMNFRRYRSLISSARVRFFGP